nr:DUF6391 domain-containing protein [Ardenticatena sp.]
MRQILGKVLDAPVVGKVRRVHALEHATITLLSMRIPNLRMVGRSTAHGFWLYGNVETEAVRRAAEDALARLQRGEAELAIHPNCGTNIAVTGVLAGLSSFAASAPWHEKERITDRVPRAIMAALAALFLARPVGFWVQRNITTSPDARALQLGEIKRYEKGGVVIHFVEVIG